MTGKIKLNTTLYYRRIYFWNSYEAVPFDLNFDHQASTPEIQEEAS